MKWIIFLTFMGMIAIFPVFFVVQVLAVDISTQAVVEGGAELTQNAYRWYDNIDALIPTSALASENTNYSTPSNGSVLRLRMNLAAGIDVATGLTLKLQFSNSTSSGFADLSTSTAWIFYDNSGVADGAIITTTVLSDSNIGESYSESNPTAASPNAIVTSAKGEWDWLIQNNGASTEQNWYFRMIFSSSTVLDAYTRYPALTGQAAATSSTPGGGSTSTGGGALLPTTSMRPGEPFPPIKKLPSACDDLLVQKVDLNIDCRVDLVDLSILLYYYEESGSAIYRYDFDESGTVDFPDVSVMMFYWTG